MTEELPISIHICDELVHQFSKITSVCNKLEAQFNFQTMTANWYNDEDNLLRVTLSFQTQQKFALYKNKKSQCMIDNHSDDVFSYYDISEKKQGIVCYIAITSTELSMLIQQQKLLSGLLNIKLHKVLNIIADKLALNPI
jgi:hypothetical protein